MKKIIILFAATCLLLASCNTKRFSTTDIAGIQNYILTFVPGEFPIGDTIYVCKSYNLQWPAAGTLTPEATDELLALCFGDSAANDVNTTAKRWLADMLFYSDWDATVLPADNVDSLCPLGYDHVETTCWHDSSLVTFLIKSETYVPLAAHGIYSADYLTVDLATGHAIHLEDLVVDTVLLGQAIARAIQDLDVNRDVRECLFDEYIDAERMPLSHNYFIDSTRSCLIINYGLYEIACYACGIQSVTLPIYWLSKHVPLTPYAKRIFGPGCSID